MKHYGIAGAGLTGAIIGRELAERGHQVTIYDQRAHVAGNCHTERVKGIMVHRYGPHIFHTDNEQVWAYVNRFAEFRPVRLKVISEVCNQHYSFPINLLTMCQVYGQQMPPSVAQMLIDRDCVFTSFPRTFEEAALSTVGKTLYKMFYKGYTEKQWGRSAKELPASVFKRIPVRMTHDDNYFYHKYQAIPVQGYTAMVENILDHKNIALHLNEPFDRMRYYDHTIWTGTIDSFFDYQLGALPYRSLQFQDEEKEGDAQGCHTVNCPDLETPYTRRVEHKHFTPWEQHRNTIVTYEYSTEWGPGMIEYYPIRLADEEVLLAQYMNLAHSVPNVTFAGRLGQYKYMDMDVTIAEALKLSKQIK